MELSQLKMLNAVARTGSIARAAEQLHCVPSNITNRLKQLESELGTPLFNRVGRGLKISTAGEVFLGYSERILAWSMKPSARWTTRRSPAACCAWAPSSPARAGACHRCWRNTTDATPK